MAGLVSDVTGQETLRTQIVERGGYSVIQNNRGFMWFGGIGLTRFDGNEFKTYTHDPSDPTSISSNRIASTLPTNAIAQRKSFFDARRDGLPSNLDFLYILEEDDGGELMPAWQLLFGSRSVDLAVGDVFELVTRKPLGPADVFEFSSNIRVAAEVDGAQPDGFRLGQNYPNPFSETTTIPFTLPQSADIEIEIFDVIGKRVDVLTRRSHSGGNQSIEWNARDLPAGAYVYRITAGDRVDTGSMLKAR